MTVDVNYDENKTTVIIHSEYGDIAGVSKCHPDDKFSKFFGAELAENRAWVKYFKRVKAEYICRMNEANNFLNILPAGKSKYIARARIHHLSHQIDRCETIIESFEIAIKAAIGTYNNN